MLDPGALSESLSLSCTESSALVIQASTDSLIGAVELFVVFCTAACKSFWRRCFPASPAVSATNPLSRTGCFFLPASVATPFYLCAAKQLSKSGSHPATQHGECGVDDTVSFV